MNYAIIDDAIVPIRNIMEDEQGLIGITVRMNLRTFVLWHPNAFYNYWHSTEGEPYTVIFPKEAKHA